mmetsp:Transcript_66220/g.191129  ORF Transcript_66220/g.191129 Transcript_66220/m.191129 type:complete len:395 (-) Transcript_66220:202-1386(-)
METMGLAQQSEIVNLLHLQQPHAMAEKDILAPCIKLPRQVRLTMRDALVEDKHAAVRDDLQWTMQAFDAVVQVDPIGRVSPDHPLLQSTRQEDRIGVHLHGPSVRPVGAQLEDDPPGAHEDLRIQREVPLAAEFAFHRSNPRRGDAPVARIRTIGLDADRGAAQDMGRFACEHAEASRELHLHKSLLVGARKHDDEAVQRRGHVTGHDQARGRGCGRGHHRRRRHPRRWRRVPRLNPGVPDGILAVDLRPSQGLRCDAMLLRGLHCQCWHLHVPARRRVKVAFTAAPIECSEHRLLDASGRAGERRPGDIEHRVPLLLHHAALLPDEGDTVGRGRGPGHAGEGRLAQAHDHGHEPCHEDGPGDDDAASAGAHAPALGAKQQRPGVVGELRVGER